MLVYRRFQEKEACFFLMYGSLQGGCVILYQGPFEKTTLVFCNHFMDEVPGIRVFCIVLGGGGSEGHQEFWCCGLRLGALNLQTLLSGSSGGLEIKHFALKLNSAWW